MKRESILVATIAACAALALAESNAADPQAADFEGPGAILIADFEGESYGEGWTLEGEAFGRAPAKGTLPGQQAVSGFLGKGLANSYLRGDGTTGSLSSPEFLVERNYIRFLIGGGAIEGKTCVNLLVDGKSVRTASGAEDETLEPAGWDVSEFKGRKARIQIVDAATCGWGHVNVDQIVQSDLKPLSQTILKNQSCEVAVSGRYLLLPIKDVKGKGRKTRLSISDGGAPLRVMNVDLADENFDWKVPVDLDGLQGRRLKISADRIPENSASFRAIEFSDSLPGPALADDKARPQFHFTSRIGWLNDPNGLIWNEGFWHLFFQSNPYGACWENMHWGHAKSKDLVHWVQEPDALRPWTFAKGHCFSGSAVVDKEGCAGFGAGALVAFFTDTSCGEAIAYSSDNGSTFKYYEGNPILKHPGRDPKVFWYAPGKHWTMIAYDESDGRKGNSIYSSRDLKSWTFESKIEGFYECPELFSLPVKGSAGESAWLMFGADNRFLAGSFDGKRFSPFSDAKLRGNYGNCLYAAQTYNSAPDGRRIQIGWATVGFPGTVFNQMMSAPVELSLKKDADGLRLLANPVKELESLRGEAMTFRRIPLGGDPKTLEGASSDLADIEAVLSLGGAESAGLKIAGLSLSFDVKSGQLSCGGCLAPMKPVGGRIKLRILSDRGLLEIFANDGEVYMPLKAPQGKAADSRIGVFAKGEGATLDELKIYKLSSIWRN